MTLDRLVLWCAGVLVTFVGACCLTARVLGDYLEHLEGESQ